MTIDKQKILEEAQRTVARGGGLLMTVRAADVLELMAENDALRDGANFRAIQSLLADCEALRKDAERYRWTAIDGNWLARIFGKWRAHTGEYGEANPTAWYPSRGEAIDAAISHAKAMAKEAK